MKKLLLSLAFVVSLGTVQAQNVYNYGFGGSTADLTTAGWVRTNQSTVTAPNAPSTTLWTISSFAPVVVSPTQNNLPFGDTVLPSGATCPAPNGQAGGTNSFAFVNYTSTSSTAADAIISNWMISPIVVVKNGDVVTFYARRGKIPGSSGAGYADRLQLRISTDGAFSVDPSTGPTDVGSYTTIAADVNPTLAADGFPSVWTKYSYTMTGLTGPTECKFGFRYFVNNGGPSQANGDIIGIDTFSVDTPEACAPPTSLVASATTTSGSTITWTGPSTAPANGYEYYISTVNTAPIATTMASGSTAAGITTKTFTGLLASTEYYVWVRSVCGSTVKGSWSASPATFDTSAAPNCPTLTAPTNNNTNVVFVSGNAVVMSWTAPTTGTAVIGYNIYFGISVATLIKLNANPINGTAAQLSGLNYDTTYFWQIRSVNAGGESVNCATFTFTTEQSPLLPYCGPLVFTTGVAPITLVNFAGINNASSNDVATGVAHENYIAIQGQVTAGTSYPITLKGNTDGNNTERFIVFIDWNQNESLDDLGEVYFSAPTAMNITNSTGLDAIQAVGSILVPANALSGQTRMRVKKIFDVVDFTDPCLGTEYGQSEDYTLNVTNLSNSSFDNASFSAMPNPVKNIINLSYNKNITNVAVINLLGQTLLSVKNDSKLLNLDISSLSTGNYLVKVTADNEVKTIKVIKE